MSYPAPENLPHDDWFMDSIPMQEWPPNSGKHNHPLPTYKDKDGNDIVNVTPHHVDIHKHKEKTMHQKMYEMATKNGGSWLGGSENCHGGSEQIQLPPRPEEEVYDDFNNTI